MNKFEKYKKILYKRIINNSIKWNQGVFRGSGKPAGWTIDMREDIFDPFYANIIAELFMKWIEDYRSDYVAGLAITGGFIASQLVLLSHMKGLPIEGLYIRKEPKVNGLQKQIEGPLRKNSTVIIVDDAINSGNSALEAIKLLAEERCLTVAFLSILNFEGKGVKHLKEFNIPLHYLFTIEELCLKTPGEGEHPGLYSLAWQAGSIRSGCYNKIPSSSPVVAGKRIFAGSDFSSCLSIYFSGVLDWFLNLENLEPVLTTPLYSDGRVYFSSSSGFLYCCDGKGSIIWKIRTGEFTDTFSPVISSGGELIFTGGTSQDGSGVLISLDPLDGHTLWKFSVEKGIVSSPAIFEDCVIISTNDGTVYCITLTGCEKWVFKSSGNMISGIAPDKGCGYFFSEGSLYSIDIFTAKELWKKKLSSLAYTTPVIYGNRLIASGSSDYVYCFNKLNGEILWQRCLSENWTMPTCPVIFRNRVYTGNSGGEIFVLKLQDGSVIWRYLTGGAITATPAVFSSKVFSLKEFKQSFLNLNEKAFNIYKNRIYILNKSGFMDIYNFEFNRLLWSFKFYKFPLEYESVLFVVSNDGYIYCFLERK